jgi:hypothetical protein
MRSIRLGPLALVLASAALWNGPARADAFTPAFIADDGESAVCQLLNVGKKPVEVQIQIRYGNGTVASESDLLTAAPGNYVSHLVEGTNSSRFYCAFVGKLKPKTVRVAGEVLISATGGQTKVVVPGF